jgi:hypothetical protein
MSILNILDYNQSSTLSVGTRENSLEYIGESALAAVGAE